jgi:putative nucleotidyltransferase with HDIG domain
MTALARVSGQYCGPSEGPTGALNAARTKERDGATAEAVALYQAAITQAEGIGEANVLAEALRRLGVLRHQRDNSIEGRALCRRSYEVARKAGNRLLAAEAVNTLGGIAMTTDSPAAARAHFLQALKLGASSGQLRARVELNLGILANIRGELDEAVNRYQLSLDAYEIAGDEHGCALAYHNLGMVSADRELLDEADHYFSRSREIAQRSGHLYLQALCLVNHAEVHIARQQFEEAQRYAEAAQDIFQTLGARAELAAVLRVTGIILRDTGRAMLSESQLQSSIALASAAGSVLNEAEGARELAILYQMMDRNQDALRLLNSAHRLFGRLDARRDLVHVAAKVAALEETYFAVVRDWGQSIESNDAYTFGHCERVARNAVAIAGSLGLDEHAQTTIHLGAYLHDVGKVRVPPGILNKPGRLTDEEMNVIRMHPVWGVELLSGVEFPWDLKPIIRWHHERCDGTGYPDQLCGDALPVEAQIVGIADMYDALTTDRAYRQALSPARALREITDVRGWWSPAVFEGFLRALPALVGPGPASASAGTAQPVPTIHR